MKRLRLVFVTRRFWPLVDSAQRAVAFLANELAHRGHDVTVVTARWEKRWPREFVHRGVPVVRLDQPQRRGWGTLTYMRGIGRWLRAARHGLDAVVVSELKHDAFAALGALAASNTPVLLRAERGGALGDRSWQQRSRFGERIASRCRNAAAIVAPCSEVADELSAGGYETDRIHAIADGVPPAEPTSDAKRQASRASLTEAHMLFGLANDAQLAIYVGPLTEHANVASLVQSWKVVLRRWPAARLWLLGEGGDSEAIWNRIKQLELESHVILPGSFDELDEVIQAADLLVEPNPHPGNKLPVLEAMSLGVPVVACDTPGHRQLIEHQRDGWLSEIGNVDSLAQMLMGVLEDRQRAGRMALGARDTISRNYSIAETADRYLDLIMSCKA